MSWLRLFRLLRLLLAVATVAAINLAGVTLLAGLGYKDARSAVPADLFASPLGLAAILAPLLWLAVLWGTTELELRQKLALARVHELVAAGGSALELDEYRRRVGRFDRTTLEVAVSAEKPARAGLLLAHLRQH